MTLLMLAVFAGCAAVFLYSYAGYPLLLLLRARLRPRPVVAADITPSVTVIVSVYNGESLIAAKVANCLALDYPRDRLEILVASDGSTDGTDDVVRGLGDERVRLVAVEPRGGKEVAQRAAIARARGEILVFTDVGVRVPPEALRALVAPFADPGVGCVSGVDRVLDASGEAVGEGAFVRYETLMKRLESLTGSTVGNSGWFFAVRRVLCDEWPSALASDFTMLLRSVRRGYRGIVEPRAVGAATATGSGRTELTRKVRTITRGMAALYAHRALLNPFRYGFFAVQLWSHKVSRWLLPFLLLGMLVSSAILAQSSLLFAGLLIAQVAFYAAGALLPSIRIPRFFVVSSVAALMAWWKFMRGERFVVWAPTPRTFGTGAAPAAVGAGRPVRVCHVIPGFQWAGAEAQTAHLVAGIVEGGGVEVSAILFHDGRLAAELRRMGVTVHVVQGGWLALIRGIAGVLRRHPADVLHTHWYKETVLGAIAGRLAGVRRFVQTVHGRIEPYRGLARVRVHVYARIDRLVERFAIDRVIAVSADLHAHLRTKLPAGRVTLIRTGIDPRRVTVTADPRAVRRDLGIEPEAPVFGTAGRLAPVKALPDLLEAARRILTVVPQARFVIVGDGPQRAELESLIERLGIGHAVRLTGFRADVLDVVNAMDVFVLPSRHEGLPIVLLEAMALGKPIVASAVGGIPEVLGDLRGWLVPPSDPTALAHACLDAWRSARDSVGAHGTRKRVDQLTEMATTMVEQTRNLYVGLGAGSRA